MIKNTQGLRDFLKDHMSCNDKTNKMTVRPAKTQISLGMHPVWSESFAVSSVGS